MENQNKISKNKRRTAMDFTNIPSMTKQSFKKGCGIDEILKKYATLGVNDLGLRLHSDVNNMTFGEFDSARDYQEKLNVVIRVNNYFKTLPSGIRDRFDNDPAQMVAFMADPKNLTACQELGLIAKPEPTNTTAAPEKDTKKNTPEKP